jgi:hypothetical protein
MIQIKKIKESKEFIIDFKQLKEAFPELAREYEKVYKKWGKRPKINVETREEYLFSASTDDSMSDYFVNQTTIFYQNGETVIFDSSHPDPRIKPAKYKLGMGDAILECNIITYYGATLIVNPSFVRALLTVGETELDFIQKYVLLSYRNLISSVRFEYFRHPRISSWGERERAFSIITIGNTYYPMNDKEYKEEIKKYGTTYQEAWSSILATLQSKGYMKIDKAGKSQLTLDGKNVAIQVENQLSKDFWDDPRVKKENSTNNKNKITESSGYYDPEFGGSENFYKAGFGKML